MKFELLQLSNREDENIFFFNFLKATSFSLLNRLLACLLGGKVCYIQILFQDGMFREVKQGGNIYCCIINWRHVLTHKHIPLWIVFPSIFLLRFFFLIETIKMFIPSSLTIISDPSVVEKNQTNNKTRENEKHKTRMFLFSFVSYSSIIFLW